MSELSGKSGRQLAADNVAKLIDALRREFDLTITINDGVPSVSYGSNSRPLPRTADRAVNKTHIAKIAGFATDGRQVFRSNPLARRVLDAASALDLDIFGDAMSKGAAKRDRANAEDRELNELRDIVLRQQARIQSLERELSRYRALEQFLVEDGRLP